MEPKIVIIGAGPTGLGAGYRLKELGYTNFQIYERSPHIGFGGGGPHFCLGTHLAKLEMKVMFDVLADRLPNIELAGDVKRLRSHFINGIKEMPVRFAT